MFSAPLFTLLLALSITGSPVKVANSPTSVPITSRLNSSNGTHNLVAYDRARFQALKGPSKHERRQRLVPLTNKVFVHSISVDIGIPSTRYELILDSSSPNTWIGAGTAYQATFTTIPTNQHVSFGSHNDDRYMDGRLFYDTVALGPGLTVVGQPIGVAHQSQGFVGFDGVFGIGPAPPDTIRPPIWAIPTVTNNLLSRNSISENILGVFFRTFTISRRDNGALTFGGTDNSRIITDIKYTPITNVWPASEYWGIKQTIRYGNTVILEDANGIIDSATIFIAIATGAFQRYKAATGGQHDPATGLLVIDHYQYGALQDLNFRINNQVFLLIPDAQIWPRAINPAIGGQDGVIYLIVCDTGEQIGQSFDFAFGHVFMQRFYTVFDGGNSRVGLAETQFTTALTNYL